MYNDGDLVKCINPKMLDYFNKTGVVFGSPTPRHYREGGVICVSLFFDVDMSYSTEFHDAPLFALEDLELVAKRNTYTTLDMESLIHLVPEGLWGLSIHAE